MRFEISPWAAVALALFWLLDRNGLIAAGLPAVLVHELGHAAAICLCGGRVQGLRAGLLGLRMDYAGFLSTPQELAAALAGPAAGLLYALALRPLPGSFAGASSALSLFLSLFNLLPAWPLDGGRALALLLGRKKVEAVSKLTASGIIVFGLWALLARGLLPPLLMGAWLLEANLAVITAPPRFPRQSAGKGVKSPQYRPGSGA